MLRKLTDLKLLPADVHPDAVIQKAADALSLELKAHIEEREVALNNYTQRALTRYTQDEAALKTKIALAKRETLYYSDDESYCKRFISEIDALNSRYIRWRAADAWKNHLDQWKSCIAALRRLSTAEFNGQIFEIIEPLKFFAFTLILQTQRKLKGTLPLAYGCPRIEYKRDYGVFSSDEGSSEDDNPWGFSDDEDDYDLDKLVKTETAKIYTAIEELESRFGIALTPADITMILDFCKIIFIKYNYLKSINDWIGPCLSNKNIDSTELWDEKILKLFSGNEAVTVLLQYKASRKSWLTDLFTGKASRGLQLLINLADTKYQSLAMFFLVKIYMEKFYNERNYNLVYLMAALKYGEDFLKSTVNPFLFQDVSFDSAFRQSKVMIAEMLIRTLTQTIKKLKDIIPVHVGAQLIEKMRNLKHPSETKSKYPATSALLTEIFAESKESKEEKKLDTESKITGKEAPKVEYQRAIERLSKAPYPSRTLRERFEYSESKLLTVSGASKPSFSPH